VSTRCPARDRPIKGGEFILGYPGEAGVPLPMPSPDVLGRNGTFVGLRKYQSRVGTFNRFLHEHAGPSRSGSCSRRSWWAAGAAAHP
jgi:deferrochelatase/peroxidase EfeB